MDSWVKVLMFAGIAWWVWGWGLWARELPVLIYDVKLGPVKMGTAAIRDLGEEMHPDLGKVRHIRVEVSTPQFKDVEEIFADPDRLVPLRVERDLVYLGSRERIVEYYDQTTGTVRVVKEGDGEKVLKSTPPVENVFLVILKAFEWGIDKVGKRINLPTYSYELLVLDGGRIRTKRGTHLTYRVITRPRKIALWIDKENLIPVRISGTVPVLPYVLSLIGIEG